jgi:imidazolonepropionase-like amidohydrolase
MARHPERFGRRVEMRRDRSVMGASMQWVGRAPAMRRRWNAGMSLGVSVALVLGGPWTAGCATTTESKVEPGEALAAFEARAHRDVEPVREGRGSVLITGATVLTAAGERWSPGWVDVVDGRIAALGAGEPPAERRNGGRPVLDASGRWVTPGIIDVHSHLGVYPTPWVAATRDGNEMTSPNTAGVWAEHSFWPEDPGLERALMGGVTTLHVLPGSGNLIGGRGVTLRLVPARGARAMRFPGAPDSVKMACGENPKRVYGGKGTAPATRMGNLRGYREAFNAAEKFRRENIDKPIDEATRDLAMETLVGVLDGRILAQVHCYTTQDMLTFLQVADEFGFKVRAFHHALEAYKIRDLLAKHDVAVATWADWWGFKLEGWDGIPHNAGLIEAAGGRAIIHSDSSEGIQRLNQEAAKAWRVAREAGLEVDDEAPLRWITANAAWALGIEAEVGTLAVGKRADIVVWNRDPMSVYAHAERVMIDGEIVFDRGAPRIPRSDFEVGLDALTPRVVPQRAGGEP